MYEIVIPEPVEKELNKRFDIHMLKRLHKRIEKLETAPDVYGKPLRGRWRAYGKSTSNFERRWRVLYTIDYERKVVTLRAVKHKDEMTK